MVPIKIRLDPDDHYDGANSIKYIVIHDTGNTTDSDEANANYFVSGTRNASAHYFVDDGSITQVVKDTDGAFHCGDGHGKYGITNRNSLSIEMCRVNGTVTAKTEANTIELVKVKMAQYKVSVSNVVRHYDASRKNCPSSFSANNWARWWEFKKKLAVPQPTAKINQEEEYKGMFSEKFYLKIYPDVAKAVLAGKAKSGYQHYIEFGKKEGRKPCPPLPPTFNEGVYLEKNIDVKKAVEAGSFTCGAEHYLQFGFAEGRVYKADAILKADYDSIVSKINQIKNIVIVG